MGMSIDESLEWLVSRKEHYEMDDNCQELAQALEDTMRKYQQIEQIYQQWNEVNDFSYNQAMQKIGEVVEDGKID